MKQVHFDQNLFPPLPEGDFRANPEWDELPRILATQVVNFCIDAGEWGPVPMNYILDMSGVPLANMLEFVIGLSHRGTITYLFGDSVDDSYVIPNPDYIRACLEGRQ